ncbi:MAG: DNA repair protein RecO, partial [Pseudomonadota bacterium]
YQVDLVRSRAGALMADGDALAAMGSMAALLTAYIGEREPHPDLYAATVGLLDVIGAAADWREAYVGWELMLIADLGYPLDLSQCAATGATEDLIWVSPKSGRAVSAKAGAPYADKLLGLPGFLRGESGGSPADGLRLTGYFLKNWVAPAFGGHAPPEARARLVERLSRGR